MHQDNYSKAPGLRRSDLWEIHKSPQHFHAKMQEPKDPSPAMLFGIAAHKYILEPDTFFDEYAVAPKVDKRTKAGKETWAAFVEDCTTNDKEAIDETTFQQIKDMTEALYANPLAKQVLEGQHETEWYWTDPDTQEPLKAKCDNITTYDGKPYIVDYKTTDSCEDGHFERASKNFGYQFQAGFYTSGVELTTKIPHGFIFVAQEKKPPYACRVYVCSDLFIENGKAQFKELLQLYHECNTNNTWYGYEGTPDNPAPTPLMDDSERFSTRRRTVAYQTGFRSDDYLTDADEDDGSGYDDI